jgi:hypothetical protein
MKQKQNNETDFYTESPKFNSSQEYNRTVMRLLQETVSALGNKNFEQGLINMRLFLASCSPLIKKDGIGLKHFEERLKLIGNRKIEGRSDTIREARLNKSLEDLRQLYIDIIVHKSISIILVPQNTEYTPEKKLRDAFTIADDVILGGESDG